MLKIASVMIMTALLSACYVTPARNVHVDQGRHLGQIKQVTGIKVHPNVVKVHPNVVQVKPVKVKAKVKPGKVKYKSARYYR
ncbi:hypothetical protein ACEE49_05170 [[Pasteurella] aerogenes]|nr:hypothetical protein [[Pasteurella] aerogenes]MCU9997561.1 hypothetical protein [[Pasteurella] aerogenes]MDY2795585.1 hypothetical protein [[Pasteurella] aerogenes]MDY4478875.1 hypothetical protein [[Pasteurella] aerogenes]VEG70209.1 Uncharacterised protein [[Pasteurella] aerogenes]